MLIVSRKIGERIRIDEQIELLIVSIDGGSVRLAVAAPEEVKVLRAELRDERRDAA